MKIRVIAGTTAVALGSLIALTGCGGFSIGEPTGTVVTVTATGECNVDEGLPIERIESLRLKLKNEGTESASVYVLQADGTEVGSIADVAAGKTSAAKDITKLAAGDYTVACKVGSKSDYVGKTTVNVVKNGF